MSDINHKLELVKWADSYGAGPSWQEIDSAVAVEHYCYSVGWVVLETDDVIVIVPHLSPQCEKIGAAESGRGDMCIPKGSIKSRKVLHHALVDNQ